MGKIKFNKIWQFNRRVLFEKLSGKKLFSIIENYLELFIQNFKLSLATKRVFHEFFFGKYKMIQVELLFFNV